MKKPIYAILSIRWGNRYTEPPDGKPRLLWSERVLWTGREKETSAETVYRRLGCYPGCGYVLCCSIETRPGKPWSLKTKGRVRKQRLKKRLDTKFPLLADQLYREELKKRPAYFKGEDDYGR